MLSQMTTAAYQSC